MIIGKLIPAGAGITAYRETAEEIVPEPERPEPASAPEREEELDFDAPEEEGADPLDRFLRDVLSEPDENSEDGETE